MKFHLRKSFNALSISLSMAGAPCIAHSTEPGSAEDPFFGELPVVLSVTRLAQSLQDTPGAVTVIDRDMIRKSGAREVAELLRLVPGFTTAYVESGGRPVANYHASLDQFGGRHMQVLVDGRSIYSSLYIGDTHRGLMGVVLDDVERIEVLRGSNSAAHGANAFLGVINIVTRNAADSRGVHLAQTSGNQGISDSVARIGWGTPEAGFRITAARSRDDGATTYRQHDDFRQIGSGRDVEKLHMRADLQPSQQDDVLIGLGQTVNRYEKGKLSRAIDPGNPAREESTRASYVQLRWTRQLSPAESFTLAANLDEENYREQFPVTLGPFSTIVGATGFSRRQSVEFQYTASPLNNVRTVFGAGFRHESLNSDLLFVYRSSTQTQSQKRLFGNVEWRIAPAWLLNVGALYEAHSETGGDLLPRLMLNYQPSPEHTFRIGATKATRAPSLFESRADQRYLDIATGIEIPSTTRIIASGNLNPERVTAHELGYLLNLPQAGVTLDVRAFHESIRDLISLVQEATYRDFSNQGKLTTRGMEYQLRWRPQADTQFILNYTNIRLDSPDKDMELRAPRHNISLALFQKLPGGFDLTLMHSRTSEFSLNRDQDTLKPISQTNARLGYPFRIGNQKAEFAVVGQALNSSHLESQRDVLVKRRAFATFRLEF